MKPVVFEPRGMDELLTSSEESRTDWIWHGMLARRNLTILTSPWKSGKTTLVAGLLRELGSGGMFLGLPCVASQTIVVSEETPQHWAARQKVIPIGPGTRLVSRPFAGRPTPERWNELVDRALDERSAGRLDVFVVDPLATFLPGRSESDPGILLDLLHPLQRLAAIGVAVLILHHPRKEKSDEGSTARGSGVLLGFVDISLELFRYGRLSTDFYRRRIAGLSRYRETPASLIYEWMPEDPVFRAEAAVQVTRFHENWPIIEAILLDRRSASTHKELLADWPANMPAPSGSQLYEWLSAAVNDGLVSRIGNGTKSRPYQFLLDREQRAQSSEAMKKRMKPSRDDSSPTDSTTNTPAA